jgi:lipopolysaccharide export system protein LptA
MSEPMTIRGCRCVAITAFVVALTLAGSPASAQKNQAPPNALQGFSQNREEPVKIRAVSLEVRDKERIATFSGDVHVIQGDTEMRCKSLVVFYDEEPSAKGAKSSDGKNKSSDGKNGSSDAGKQIRRIEAKGGVTVQQKEQNAAGDSGIFDMRANTVTLLGNVVVTQGTDVLRGQRLFVDLASGRTTLDSGPGRVEGLFMPKSRSSEKR